MAQHTVKQGETVEAIARQHKVPVRSVLAASENADLFATRTPEQLFEGDAVFVPDEPPKHVSVRTDGGHTFVVRPRRLSLRVQFLLGGAPRSEEACRVSVDGGEAEDTTLSVSGWLDHPVDPAAQEVVVVFHADTDYEERATLNVGHLDPVTEVRGVQQRLNNLGLRCGAEDGDAAERTTDALRIFQAMACESDPTGTLDDDTRERLAQRHGS